MFNKQIFLLVSPNFNKCGKPFSIPIVIHHCNRAISCNSLLVITNTIGCIIYLYLALGLELLPAS